MFYMYSQNNSGGKFIINESVGEYVIIEAKSPREADDIAKVFGIYFDGCDNGIDCSCCGDRWYRSYDNGSEEPEIYGKTIEEFKKDPSMVFGREKIIHIYYLNGKHQKISFDAVEAVKKNQSEKRKKARKLWGNYFSLNYGVRNKNPIRFYEHTYLTSKSEFYDKSEDLSIEEGLCFERDCGWVSFSSENKAEVLAFMEGAKEVMAAAKEVALQYPSQDGTKGKGIMAAAKLFANIKER
jgi:hypothetical protein